MKKSQLNAISYAYLKREKERLQAELERRGWQVLYKYQDTYKSVRGILNASPKMLEKARATAVAKIEARIKSLKGGSLRHLLISCEELEQIKDLKF